MFGVEVYTGCWVDTCVEVGSTLTVDVKVLVVTGVAVVDGGALPVFVGVTEDVIVGVEVVSVMTDSVGTSLVGVSVVFQVDVA